MSFKDHVRKAQAKQIADDLRADFLNDAIADKHIPDAKTWEQLSAYLRRMNACEEAMLGARMVWRDYEKTRKGK